MKDKECDLEQERWHSIDLLRIFACLSVVLFHFGFLSQRTNKILAQAPALVDEVAKYGYLGVDLFFLISGFLIIKSAREKSWAGFVIGRITRIYPAYFICCTITYLTIANLDGGVGKVSLKDYLVNLTLLNGPFKVPHVDGVYWTLWFEIRFYFIVALISAIDGFRRFEMVSSAWIILCFLAELSGHSTFKSLVVSEFASYFIGGGLLYLTAENGPTIKRSILLCFCVVWSAWKAIERASWFEGTYQSHLSPYVLAAVVSAFYLILILLCRFRLQLGKGSIVSFVAAVTYPLYLLHQNIGFTIASFLPTDFGWTLSATIAFISVVSIAYVVFVFLEKPLKGWIIGGIDYARGFVRS